MFSDNEDFYLQVKAVQVRAGMFSVVHQFVYSNKICKDIRMTLLGAPCHM